MTEQEATMIIQAIPEKIWNQLSGSESEAMEMAFKALEEVEKLRFENRALKNRCYVLTRGMLCSHCPIDCSDRTVDFGGMKNDAD